MQTDRAVVYYGIPFAEPPVDALRWKAPQDPAPWSGTLAATERKQVCTQAGMSPTWHASGEIIGGEDCLYLDVYRPNNAQRDLPVYVYLHGGANRFGGASSYDG
ncbi:MAG: carboxylesterase family protein, partial [Desulfatitalea sp.]|nr:carboxylesterase family protein [Desulfatitalea sp.]